MKAVVTVLLVISLFLSGCSNVSTYYYHPEKTLEQAEEDWQKCHEGLISSTFKGTVIRKNFAIEYFEEEADECMSQHGYIQIDEPDLPVEIRKKDSAIGHISYSIAGK